MNKREFLETLKEALSEEMPASLVRENVQYYSQYIDGEVEKGCTEKEAVAKLGAPRLIAKTLLEAFETTGQTYGSDGNQTAYQDKYGRQNGRLLWITTPLKRKLCSRASSPPVTCTSATTSARSRTGRSSLTSLTAIISWPTCTA